MLESTAQFGDLPADIAEKIKYAKVRTVEIAKAVKEGRAPAPPPVDDPPPDFVDLAPVEAGSSDAPPPSYMDLPTATTTMPPASYMDLPSAVPPAMPPPPPVPQAPAVQSLPSFSKPTGFKPKPKQIMEASRLCSTAVSALQFQDSDSAVYQLMQALNLLTQPQAADVPGGEP